MVNDFIEELMDLDMEPKPESLWWKSAYQDEDVTTLKVGNRGHTVTPAIADRSEEFHLAQRRRRGGRSVVSCCAFVFNIFHHFPKKYFPFFYFSIFSFFHFFIFSFFHFFHFSPFFLFFIFPFFQIFSYFFIFIFSHLFHSVSFFPFFHFYFLKKKKEEKLIVLRLFFRFFLCFSLSSSPPGHPRATPGPPLKHRLFPTFFLKKKLRHDSGSQKKKKGRTRMSDDSVSKQRTTCLITLWLLNVLLKND